MSRIKIFEMKWITIYVTVSHMKLLVPEQWLWTATVRLRHANKGICRMKNNFGEFQHFWKSPKKEEKASKQCYLLVLIESIFNVFYAESQWPFFYFFIFSFFLSFSVLFSQYTQTNFIKAYMRLEGEGRGHWGESKIGGPTCKNLTEI